MSMGVVYFLEMVNVNHNERERKCEPFRPSNLPSQNLIEFYPVGNSGQGIHCCLTYKDLIQTFQLLVSLIALSYVAHKTKKLWLFL